MGQKTFRKRNTGPIVLGSRHWSFADADDIAFFPDGERVAVGARGGAVRVLSSKGDVIAGWDLPVSVLSLRVAVSPDGDTVVVGSCLQGLGPTVSILSVKTGRRRDLKGHRGDASPEIALSSNGTQALTGDDEGNLRLWDLSNGKKLESWTFCNPYTIGAVAITPCGKALLALYGSAVVRFDMATGDKSRFEGVDCCFTQSPDGSLLAGASYRSAIIKVWNVSTERSLDELVPDGGSETQVNRLRFCPDGRLIAAYDDGSLRLWDLAENRLQRTYTGHTASASAVDVSDDGKFAVSVSDDATVRLWEISTGREVTKADRPSGRVCAIAWGKDGQSVIAVHGGNHHGLVLGKNLER